MVNTTTMNLFSLLYGPRVYLLWVSFFNEGNIIDIEDGVLVIVFHINMVDGSVGSYIFWELTVTRIFWTNEKGKFFSWIGLGTYVF